MNCVITSANIFSGQSAVTSRIFPVRSAVSVRESTPDRPFVCPVLVLYFENLLYLHTIIMAQPRFCNEAIAQKVIYFMF